MQFLPFCGPVNVDGTQSHRLVYMGRAGLVSMTLSVLMFIWDSLDMIECKICARSSMPLVRARWARENLSHD